MKFLSEMNPKNFDDLLNNAISNLQLLNELHAEKAKNERLIAEIASLKEEIERLRKN